MRKKDKYMINTVWELMSKDNTKIWVSKVIKVDLTISEDLVISGVSLEDRELRVLKISSMDLKNLYSEIKVNQIALREERILFYIWK